MRNLSKELNVQAPTIYWYFKSNRSAQLLFGASFSNSLVPVSF
ncbi:TetR family transcriptional regulator [Paenibacillus azoreducens]|nr:TetR family transcriptional regulator [Paenibacillus azoreducens]